MAEHDQKVRFFQIAALCGALGVASGYAIFLISDDIHDHPWRFGGALLGAASICYVIEWLRDVIRDGEIEVKEHWVVRSIGTFVVVLLFELFIAGFHEGFQMGPDALGRAAESLLGSEGSFVQNVHWTVILVSGMWVVAGALLAGWLSLQIGRDEDKTTGRQIVRGSRWGTIGGLVIAPAVIALYILGGRALVAFHYFLTNARAANMHNVGTDTWFNPSRQGGVMWIMALPLELLQLAATSSQTLFWLCYVGMMAAMAILLGTQKRWKTIVGFNLAFRVLLLGLTYGVLSPVVRSIWVVLMQLLKAEARNDLFDAVLLGAVIWAIPGLLLGGLVPLLKRAGHNPQSWAFIGYGASLLLILAYLLTGAVWALIPAAVALGSGVLFHRGMPVKEFWPFAALCVAIGISGAMSLSQKLTFDGVLLALHHIDELQPPDALKTDQEKVQERAAQAQLKLQQERVGAAIVASMTPADLQYLFAVEKDADAREADRKKQEELERQRAAKILEIAITGSVGFWVTVGLLACWSMYEREHGVETGGSAVGHAVVSD